MVEFNRGKLKNGLTILHEKRDVPVTTVMMGVRFGSMYESIEEKGIAHFMEHLCFKGTEKRTTDEIAQELEGRGGELNAFTSEEITAYHVRLPSKHLELAIDVIGDIFFNPTFPEEEFDREASVICEEIKMYKDNPRIHSFVKVKAELYDEPFGMSIAGSEKTVKSMTQKQLLEKHRSLYVPKNSVLCVVGDNSFEDVVKFAEKYLLVEREGEDLRELNIKKKVSGGKESRKDIMQTNLCLGVHFPSLSEDKRYAAEVFSAILGEGMSSRLFREVREKRGLVYGVKSDLDLGRNYGYMVVWAGCDPQNKDQVIEICKKEFENMKNLTEEELNEAKEKVIGKNIIESEGSNDSAIHLIMEEFATRAENVYEYEKKINDVSLEEVRELAFGVSGDGEKDNSGVEWAEFWVGP